MYLSKVSFREPKYAWRELTHEYSLHQKIWRLMSRSEEQPRDFLYRVVSGTLPVIYVQSEEPPIEQDPLFISHTKAFHPVLNEGLTLQFNVRVNPVVAVESTKGEKSKRHDVVMHKKHLLRGESISIPPMNELIHDAMEGWIKKRQERCGFEVVENSLMFSEYTQRQFIKKKAARPIALTTVDITGLLVVHDSVRFTETLFSGLGAAKGFGCGLMLIRPAA